jgi:hypothetical protein
MTVYHSSTGPKVVEEMGRDNAFHAAAKLRRDGFGDSENTDETLAALDAHVAKLDAEFEAAKAPLIAAGYSTREAYDAIGKKHYEGWLDDAEGLRLVSSGNKTEGAAWADMIKRYGAEE